MEDQRPAGYNVFLAYSLSLALAYFLVAGLGVLFLTGVIPSETEAEALIMGVVMTAMGVVLLGVSVVMPFLPRTKAAWIGQLVFIGMGTSSCCWLPLSIYLLIAWTKPEVKAYYGA